MYVKKIITLHILVIITIMISCANMKSGCNITVDKCIILEDKKENRSIPQIHSFTTTYESLQFPENFVQDKNDIENDNLIPAIKEKSGQKALYRIHYSGDYCTSTEIDKYGENIFQDYADRNRFSNFKVLQKPMDEHCGYRSYLVTFN